MSLAEDDVADRDHETVRRAVRPGLPPTRPPHFIRLAQRQIVVMMTLYALVFPELLIRPRTVRALRSVSLAAISATLLTAGQRPVWRSFSRANALVVSSQDAPGWYLTIHDGGTTVLKHNDRLAGTGECISPRYGKSGDVGDVGNVADMGGE